MVWTVSCPLRAYATQNNLDSGGLFPNTSIIPSNDTEEFLVCLALVSSICRSEAGEKGAKLGTTAATTTKATRNTMICDDRKRICDSQREEKDDFKAMNRR